jgi:hypothetical protein
MQQTTEGARNEELPQNPQSRLNHATVDKDNDSAKNQGIDSASIFVACVFQFLYNIAPHLVPGEDDDGKRKFRIILLNCCA